MFFSEALTSLCGNEQWLQDAIDIMNSQKDENGRLTLAGALSKSYLPKECIGKPSKWATFYAVLADKHINVNNG